MENDSAQFRHEPYCEAMNVEEQMASHRRLDKCLCPSGARTCLCI